MGIISVIRYNYRKFIWDIAMDQKQTHTVRRRGIYLLPNLLTTAGLFAGFYAIVSAMEGFYEIAAIAMFIAMIADTLDGRVARLLHASTDFGVQYDSLSDMVSFGIAPALVLFSWGLKDLGKVGWLIAFLYAACVALRLARFNVQTGESDKRYFIGLACTPAAAVVASMVWYFSDYQPHNFFTLTLLSIITLGLSACMVSSVLYRSFKEVNLKDKTSFISIFIVVLIFIAISLNPPLVLLVFFSLYALSGPIFALQRRYKKIKAKSQFPKHDNAK